jgi:hypothetical protein
MQRWLEITPGALVGSPVEPTLSLGVSLVGFERSLDLVEALLATLPPQTPLAEPHGQALDEIRYLLAALASDLLGEGHPVVSAIAKAPLTKASLTKAPLTHALPSSRRNSHRRRRRGYPRVGGGSGAFAAPSPPSATTCDTLPSPARV